MAGDTDTLFPLQNLAAPLLLAHGLNTLGHARVWEKTNDGGRHLQGEGAPPIAHALLSSGSLVGTSEGHPTM